MIGQAGATFSATSFLSGTSLPLEIIDSVLLDNLFVLFCDAHVYLE